MSKIGEALSKAGGAETPPAGEAAQEPIDAEAKDVPPEEPKA